MRPLKVIIVSPNKMTIEKLNNIVIDAGHVVINIFNDVEMCLRKIRSLNPDLLVVELGKNPANDINAIGIIKEDMGVNSVVMLNENQKCCVADSYSDDNIICLVKPINKTVFTTTIEIFGKSSRTIKTLQNELKELKLSLETRKDIEKAKGLLMKHQNVSEEDAYKKIQKQSMDKGIPMKEIAKAIVLTYSIYD